MLTAELFFHNNYKQEQLKFNIMGRGDKKTKKGKIFKGSFGKSRPANPKKATATTTTDKKES